MPAASVDVGEAAVAVVAVQPIGHRLVGARAAVIARADRVVAQLVAGDREVQVVGDEQIEVAIAIVVDKRRAGAPLRVADARLPVTSVNVPLPLLRIQRLRTEGGDEEIEVAVVVVVADRRAHAVARAGRRRRARSRR